MRNMRIIVCNCGHSPSNEPSLLQVLLDENTWEDKKESVGKTIGSGLSESCLFLLMFFIRLISPHPGEVFSQEFFCWVAYKRSWPLYFALDFQERFPAKKVLYLKFLVRAFSWRSCLPDFVKHFCGCISSSTFMREVFCRIFRFKDLYSRVSASVFHRHIHPWLMIDLLLCILSQRLTPERLPQQGTLGWN